MKNISIFQLVLLILFGLFLMGGIIVVAIYSKRGGEEATQVSNVTIWGTFDGATVQKVIDLSPRGEQNVQITYVQRSERTFDLDLAEAIATGRGPDIVLLRQDSIVANLTKLRTLSYSAFPSRQFKDTFLEEGEMFMSSKGIFAMPFVIDPLVMYWNRDLFSRKGLSNPPRYWDELYSLAESLTTKDSKGGIVQSGVGMGGFSNIKNAKEILSGLLLQSGNSITMWNPESDSLSVTLLQSQTPARDILSFYSQFADARKSVYSWSLGLPDSESMFLSNRLGVYFGFASEAKILKSKSPNLNFDVAYFPQTRNGSFQGTFGRLYGLAMLGTSRDPWASLATIQRLTSPEAIKILSETSGLPSVRRDVDISSSSDPNQPVFSRSALVSRAWLEPRASASETVFKEMVESVLAGFSTPSEAVENANQQLQTLIPR